MKDVLVFKELAIEAAHQVGNLLRENFRQGHRFELKSSFRDLVTEFDRRAEEIIVSLIRKHFPEHSILTEEGSVDPTDRAPYQWIIDPIDGTANFAHGFPFFAVSIALYYQDEALLGVVYNPVHDELFVGEAGGGAQLNGQTLRVSQVETLHESLVMTGFPYDERLVPKHLTWWERFARKTQSLRRLGSSALALAYVAAGRADGYWELDLKPWDMAAGVLLVREAGGRVTDLEGNKLDLNRGEVLASNGKVHNAMLQVLQGRA
ncbi:MAG: inositol monophosphatase [Candidatus Bipolaricaulota bacterium]|nr:inositol monophosphatase [Candidatus Bipolaricaulota bacterium]MDW8030699.1 inositol monophosphatase family protein [Candidatus Bipolaricaulota bacterium]